MIPSILLVEDDPHIARLLEIYLGRDFRVQRTGTFQAAVAALSNATFDCAVLDVTLPDRPGWELITLLKQEHPATCILVMTGRTDAETRQKALAMGAQQVINKPLAPADVKRAIQSLL